MNINRFHRASVLFLSLTCLIPFRPARSSTPIRTKPATLTGDKATAELKKRGQYQSLMQAFQAARYMAEPIRQGGRPTGEYFVFNPAHDMTARLGESGLKVAGSEATPCPAKSRNGLKATEETVAAPQGKPWSWNLSLSGYGYGQNLQRVTPTGRYARDNRMWVQYNGGVKEWFINGKTGVEHGFNIDRRPAGQAGSQKLRLELAVGGNLKPLVSTEDRLSFGRASGKQVLTYEKLRVWDANHRAVAAGMKTVSSSSGTRIVLEVQDQHAVYPLTIDPLIATQEAKILPTGDELQATTATDRFGNSVSVSGDTVLIGAYTDDTPNDNGGAAYVFTRSGGIWTLQQRLLASDADAGNWFGYRVALDGDTAAIAALYADGQNETGAVNIFTRSGTVWTEQAIITKPNGVTAKGSFANSVAVSGDTVIIGTKSTAFAYHRSGTTWSVQGELFPQAGDLPSGHTASGGSSVAIDGDTAVVGSSSAETDGNTGTFLEGAAYVYTRTAGVWDFQQEIFETQTGGILLYGGSVAVSGNTVVVGATDVDRTVAGTFIENCGAVFVYTRSGTVWTKQQHLSASDPVAGNQFGNAVSIDGDTILVGSSNAKTKDDGTIFSATRAGSAYVFTRSGTTWTQEAGPISPASGLPGDRFGTSVSIDGNTAVMGADGDDTPAGTDAGSAFVYTRSGTTWSLEQQLNHTKGSYFSATLDDFGTSVSLSGDTALIGAPGDQTTGGQYAGSAYVFTRGGSTWAEQARLKASDEGYGKFFGSSVSLDGNTAIVGATGLYTGQGGAYVFTRSGSTWTQQQRLSALESQEGDGFGTAVALDGDTTIVAAPGGNDWGTGDASGDAYVFTRTAGVWTEQAMLTPSDPEPYLNFAFGSAVAVDGDTAVIGAPQFRSGMTTVGAAYVFKRTGSAWSEQKKLMAPDPKFDDGFGSAVAVDGDTAVVGAPSSAQSGTGSPGAAYVFIQSSGSWSLQTQLSPSDGAESYYFGSSVALDGDTALVGAPIADSWRGYVYVYTRLDTSWSERGKLTPADPKDNQYFGRSVSLDGDTALVGAPGDTNALGTRAGAAYVFRLAYSGAPPQVTLPNGTLAYTENDPATIIDSGATVTDADSTDFDTGSLTVDFSAGGTDDDRLAIRDQGTNPGQIGVAGTNVTYEGNVIGSFTGGQGTTPLVITFNATVTPAIAQALARNITFANVSDAPSGTDRLVRFAISDGDGESSTASKTITVTPVNDAPVLDPDGDLKMTDLFENTPDYSNYGDSISAIMSSSGTERVTDVDAGPDGYKGIAVTAVDNTNGKWQYSLDGGSTWSDFGSPSNTGARLIAFGSQVDEWTFLPNYIRFVPNADYVGTVTSGLTIRAWDGTSGNDGDAADTSTNGGSTAFSAATDTVSITIKEVNASPVLDATKSPVLNAVGKDAGAPSGAVGTLVSSLVDFNLPAGQLDNVTDTNTNPLLGIAVTGLSSGATLYYSLNDGTNWTKVTSTLSDYNALLLSADSNTRLYFQPPADFSGPITNAITFRAWDRTDTNSWGDVGDYAYVAYYTGTTPFSDDSDTASIAVNAANAAPTATNLGAAETYSEDTPKSLTAIVVSDDDNSELTVTLTLSDKDAGSLNTATSNAVTSTYDETTGVWTASGAKADLNILLAALVYTPAPEYSASFTIATKVSDGELEATGTKSLTGTPVNDPPTATNLSAADTYTEDTAKNLTDIVVSDIDNTNLTVTLTLSDKDAGSLSTATSGDVTSTYSGATGVWSASGAVADLNILLADLTFTPAANYNSNFTIATKVSDGEHEATGSKTMTAIPANDAPEATNLNAAETYSEDTTKNLTDIVVSDIDSANLTVTLTLSDKDAGSLSTATSGDVTSTYSGATGVWSASGAVADINILLADLTFTPATNYNADFAIATKVSDGDKEATGSKAMMGTAVNDVPQLTNSSPAETYTEDTPEPLDGLAVSDVDNANLTITLTLSDKDAGSLNTATSNAVTSEYDGATGVWTASGAKADVNTLLAGLIFTPASNYNSNFSISIKVSDGDKEVTGSKAFTGTAVNDKPTVADDIDDVTVDEDAADSVGDVAPNFYDVEDDANLTYSVAGNDNTSLVTVTHTGSSFTLHFNANQYGTANITIRATDPGEEYVEDKFKVTVNAVNDVPVLDTISNTSGNEGTAITFTATASDDDSGDSLTFSLKNAPTGATINPETGAFTWTPTEAQGPGEYTFTVKVKDGHGGCDEQSVTITVYEVNQAPTITPVPEKTVTKGSLLTFAVAAVDGDLPAQTLSYWLEGAPVGADIGGSTGVFTWTPTGAQGPATYNFKVKVSDGVVTSEQPIKINVTDANQPPVLTTIGNKSVTEENTVSFAVTGSDPDVPMSALTFSASNLPSGASFNPSTRVFTWTPTEAQGPASYNMVFRVSDGTLTDSKSVTITVNEANKAPVLNVGSARTIVGDRWTSFSVSATDADLPANALQYSVSPPAPISGVGAPQAFVDSSTGVVSLYAPPSTSTYNFSLTFAVRDSGGLIDTKLLSITVNPPLVVWMVTPTFTTSELTAVYTLKNNSTQPLNGIWIQGTAYAQINSITKSVGTLTQQVQSNGQTGIVWNGFSLGVGQQATLTVKLKRLTGSGKLMAGVLYPGFSTTGNGTVPSATPVVNTP